MSHGDDWLWDGSGAPDPEEARLAGALGALRRDRALPPLPPRPEPGSEPRPEPRPGRWWAGRGGIALTMTLTLTLTMTALALLWPAGWEVRTVGGAPPCRTGICRLGEGGALEAGPESRWEVAVAGLGTLRLEPGARLVRLESAGAGAPGDPFGRHLLRLEAGAVDVELLAPPRAVIIETPAATAIDLGCAYRLAVVDAGDRTALTVLTVRAGVVALENPQGISVVGAGYGASVRAGQRPELPVHAGAGAALRAAIRAADPATGGDPAGGRLSDVLALAGAADALTLWHLLQMAPEAERRAVFDRMAALIPGILPTDEAAVLRLDPAALRLLWKDLSGG